MAQPRRRAPHHPRRAMTWQRLVRCIDRICRRTTGLQVYLEPGEAVVLNAGYPGLHRARGDAQRHKDIAILDTSAACHMPDVLEVPYRPPVYRGGEPGKKAYHLSCWPAAPASQATSSVSIRSTVALGAGEQARVRGHGALHHGQDQYVQRHAAAAHRGKTRRRHG